MKSLVLLLHLFLGVVLSFPFQDSPSTFVVDLQKGENQLLVKVARMVDLTPEDNNDNFLFAERTLSIRFELDVVDKQIKFNDQPIELGVSTFEIDAQIITKPEKVQKQQTPLIENFDSGLVTIQVTAVLLAEDVVLNDEINSDDDLVFRRIEIKQDIVKINNKNVIKTNAGQQVIDMFDCGSYIKWSVDPATGLPPPLPKEKIDTGKEWENPSNMIRGFIGGSLCTLFFGIIFALRQFIRNERVNEEEDQEERPPAYEEIPILKL